MAVVLVVGNYGRSLVRIRGSLLQAMASAGHSVVACAPPEASAGVGPELEAIGVGFAAVPLARTGFNPAADLRTVAALCALMRRIRPEMCLLYTVKPVIYGSLAARLCGIRRVFSMITGLGYAFSAEDRVARTVGVWVRWLYALSLGTNARLFFQNLHDRDTFVTRRLLEPRAAVLINGSGVDLDAFQPVAAPKDMSFLMIARLLTEKGIVEYVDAARRLRTRYPWLRFRLAGWLEDRPGAIGRAELRAWTHDGVIEYLGRLDDVRKAIAESAVFVLPSYSEGMPRVVLEAMAMARPVVATRVPGCADAVLDGVSGFLVPPRDHVALADALERFVLDDTLVESMGRQGRRIAEAKFDVHDVNAVVLETMGLAAPRPARVPTVVPG